MKYLIVIDDKIRMKTEQKYKTNSFKNNYPFSLL